jgi:hypothetical protein
MKERKDQWSKGEPVAVQIFDARKPYTQMVYNVPGLETRKFKRMVRAGCTGVMVDVYVTRRVAS